MPKGGNARTQPPSHHENAILLGRFTRDPFYSRFRHGFRAARDRTRIQSAAVGAVSPGCPVDTICPPCSHLSARAVGAADADLSTCALGASDAVLSAGPDPSGSPSGGAPSGRSAAGDAPDAAYGEADAAGADAASIHPAAGTVADAAERHADHPAGFQFGDSPLHRRPFRTSPAVGDPANAEEPTGRDIADFVAIQPRTLQASAHAAASPEHPASHRQAPRGFRPP
jgi:hypothetical protein